MNARRGKRIVILTAFVLSSCAIAALSTWHWQTAPPKLDEIRALARAGEFTRAQGLLERFLQAFPRNDRARMLMAQLTPEPTNAQPEVPLSHLRSIPSSSSRDSALLQFLSGKAR